MCKSNSLITVYKKIDFGQILTLSDHDPYLSLSLCCRKDITVWKKIIFRDLEDYNSANMTDIHKIPFDYCLDTNTRHVRKFMDIDILKRFWFYSENK